METNNCKWNRFRTEKPKEKKDYLVAEWNSCNMLQYKFMYWNGVMWEYGGTQVYWIRVEAWIDIEEPDFDH